jgi:pimeloyl-ACP methyl ester carboxylesterase
LEDLTNKNAGYFKINFSNGKIGCRVLGNGQKNMICFYGFGQSTYHLNPLCNAMGAYTFYVFDLPFHGNSIIDDPNISMDCAQVVEIIQNLMIKTRITKFSFLGISIGSKLVLQGILSFAAKIEKVFLIAPDGIIDSFWYKFATRNSLLRLLFRQIMLRGNLDRIIGIGQSLRFIDVKTAAFAKIFVKKKEDRDRVYNTWTYLRNLKVNTNLVAKALNENSIEVIFVVGKNDRIIPKKSISVLSNKIDKKQIVELNSGHYNILDNYCKKIMLK